MRYAWIKVQPDHRVRTLCRVLGVSASGYYAWRGRKPGLRAIDDDRLLRRIEHLHTQTREAYGTERMWQALRQAGESCGRHRVRRLRNLHGIGKKQGSESTFRRP